MKKIIALLFTAALMVPAFAQAPPADGQSDKGANFADPATPTAAPRMVKKHKRHHRKPVVRTNETKSGDEQPAS
jgi:hypothetical protein